MRTRTLTPATIISIVALLFSVTGTAAAGALITGAMIKNGTLSGLDVHDGWLRSVDVKNGTLAVDLAGCFQPAPGAGRPGRTAGCGRTRGAQGTEGRARFQGCDGRQGLDGQPGPARPPRSERAPDRHGRVGVGFDPVAHRSGRVPEREEGRRRWRARVRRGLPGRGRDRRQLPHYGGLECSRERGRPQGRQVEAHCVRRLRNGRRGGGGGEGPAWPFPTAAAVDYPGCRDPRSPRARHDAHAVGVSVVRGRGRAIPLQHDAARQGASPARRRVLATGLSRSTLAAPASPSVTGGSTAASTAGS